jgi:hypothetical protein
VTERGFINCSPFAEVIRRHFIKNTGKMIAV